MYNLLVTAKRGAWDDPFYEEFDKSRFLEYTTESVAEAFRSLSTNLIGILIGYPCIFAYEGEDQDLRIGRLTSIKEGEENYSSSLRLIRIYHQYLFQTLSQ